MHSDWIVVVPFRAAAAKSRFGPDDNSAIATAMALDTVEAALQVARVIVVTDVPAGFIALGAAVLPDPGSGLTTAIEAGLERAGTDIARAVLLGDHPALTPAELLGALDAATHPRSLVTDAAGGGSAMTTARPGVQHAPLFGPGSRAAHLAAGYVELEGDWPGLRADVDTPVELARLPRTGPRTTVWLRASGR